MRIVCSGHLVRYPLGGHSWHHLQYLIGLARLGHDVVFFEHFGWPQSCYDPSTASMTDDPGYGVAYTQRLLDRYGLGDRWCYLAADGTAHGMSRESLGDACRDSDLYLNLSNINWIPELDHARRRVLVDTDPVFTQIGAFGMGGPFTRYHALFTYGENVHRAASSMPTGDAEWLPTRQPVVLDLWPGEQANPEAPFTTVMNWSNFGQREYRGRTFGQKDIEFRPYFDLPRTSGEPMEIAVSRAPSEVRSALLAGGWRLRDPADVSRDPWTYQDYLSGSRAEFCVAKHAYVSTWCGWFSDRSAAYLALGRPVVIQDTGFTDNIASGEGLLAFRDKGAALAALGQVTGDYERHCRAARRIAEEYFDARVVLTALLDRAM